jgi:ABC-type glutathione transport system ATPase component
MLPGKRLWGRVAEQPRATLPVPGDPVRPEEDAGFLPRPDGSGQPRCYRAAGAGTSGARTGGSDMLELKGLTRRYGDLVALDDLSFAVREGQMFGFVGPNGAGKTTAMRIVLGVLEPDTGEVRWRGRPVDAETRSRFGYMPEDHGQTFFYTVRCPSIEPADRGDGRWRDVPAPAE